MHSRDVLEDVQLLVVERQVFYELLNSYECGRTFIEQSFQRVLQQKEHLEYNRITKTADELYNELVINRPNWLQKIPQYQIASYLNVTPETLSRIRKRMS